MAIAFSVLIFVLFVAAIIDAITIDRSRVRFLDKFFWIVIVILIPAIGSVLWFVFGREYLRAPRIAQSPSQWTSPKMGSSVQTSRSDTEVQLAALEREIAADRVRALEAEVRAKRGLGAQPGAHPSAQPGNNQHRNEHNSGQSDPDSGTTPPTRDDTGPPA